VTTLSLVGYTYRGYEMAYALGQARAFGYQGIELRDFADIDLSCADGLEHALDRAQRACSELGLRIVAAFFSPLHVRRGAVMAENAAEFSRALASLAAHQVPILHTRVSMAGGHGGELVSADALEEDYAAAQSALNGLAVEAASCGVQIAVETHMGTIHDTVDAQLRLLRGVTSPAVGACLDFANALIQNRQEDVYAAVAACRERLCYVHLKNVRLLPAGYDWNVPLRYGDVNYARVLRALRENGYGGPLAVEYCGTGDPDVFAEEDARYLSDLVRRVGQ